MLGVEPGADQATYSRRGNLQKYSNRNPLQRFLIWHFHRRVEEMVEALQPSRILDVGCGEGYTIDRLLRSDGRLPIQGVDYDWPALSEAKRKHPELLFQMGDIGRIPYTSGSFDLVLCLEVLEHVARPLEALEELRRVTSQHCLMSIPNEPFFTISNFLRGKNVRAWGNDPEHLHRWTAAQFLELVGNWFTVERVAYPFPWVIALGRRQGRVFHVKHG